MSIFPNQPHGYFCRQILSSEHKIISFSVCRQVEETLGQKINKKIIILSSDIWYDLMTSTATCHLLRVRYEQFVIAQESQFWATKPSANDLANHCKYYSN